MKKFSTMYLLLGFQSILSATLIFSISNASPPNQIENLYVPRFCRSITANVIALPEGSVAAVGGMILGNIIECTESEMNPVTETHCVQFKGEFTRPSGECPNSSPSSHENGRHLDLKHDGLYWKNAKVYYEILDGFDTQVEKAIRAAVWLWTQNSPARLVEDASASDRLVFTPVGDDSCVSYVGKIGGEQNIVLDAYGACAVGSITHEIGHAIGFYHEHTRPDRLNYITINEGNIIEGYTYQFDEVTDQLYNNHPYDYGSIMHYPADGFTNSGNSISVVSSEFNSYLENYPNELPEETLGQRTFLSTIDKQMGYTYLNYCVDDSSTSSYTWKTGEWGGCEPQCPVSYRQRMVFCRHQGECVDDSLCDASTKPATRKLCELGPGITNITFEEANDWDKGVPMQNVPYYDQFDWYLWQGYPADLTTNAKTIVGDLKFGPGVDADGNEDGHYLWFTSQNPSKLADEAWWESPIVATTNSEKCEVTFSYFIGGKRGRLQMYAVPCTDCTSAKEIWYTTNHKNEWTQKTVEVPQYSDDDVRIRFVAHRGVDGNGEFGLDNIIFSAGCVRSDIDATLNATMLNTTSPMSSPYVLDPNCIYYAVEGFVWGTFEIAVVACAAFICLLILICTLECFLRCRKWYRIKRGMKDITGSEDHYKARMKLKSFHATTLFTNAFSGAYERIKRAKRAFTAAYEKAARQQTDDQIVSKAHGNKSMNKSVYFTELEDPEEAKPQAMNRLERKVARTKVKARHFAEKTGLLDRLDCILKCVSFGRVHENNWHSKSYRAPVAKDKRSMRRNSKDNDRRHSNSSVLEE
mmetsp:Transcript_19225/g.25325  ORF Transcript_19225/g.25325 Transcript_19225/m.25325 type:complete len:809 (-) Transcript_19225:230-2656(-)